MEQLSYYWRKVSFNQILIGFNVFMFIVSTGLGLIVGQTGALVLLGAESSVLVFSGEVWRLLTYAFLHGNILHLGLNMYALWYLGDFIESYFGRQKLVIVYVFTAIFAGALSSLSNLGTALSGGNIDSVNYISVGASGAIFGILGLILGNVLINRRYGFQLPIDRNQLIFIIVLNLMLGFSLSGINNIAHVGGLISGLILSLIIDPVFSNNTNTLKKLFSQIAFPISILLIFASFAAQIIAISLALFLN